MDRLEMLVLRIATERACDVPPDLHPLSEWLLTGYLWGWVPEHVFAFQFHFPNSAYIGIAECIVRSWAQING